MPAERNLKYDAHVWARLANGAVEANDCPECHKKHEPCWTDEEGRRFVWDGNAAHRCVDTPPKTVELWD